MSGAESLLRTIVEGVKADLAATLPDAAPLREVSVGTLEWEDGYFLMLDAVDVVLTDGEVVTLDTDDLSDYGADLTEAFGPVGKDTRLTIDAATLETRIDHDGSVG